MNLLILPLLYCAMEIVEIHMLFYKYKKHDRMGPKESDTFYTFIKGNVSNVLPTPITSQRDKHSLSTTNRNEIGDGKRI